MFDTERFVLDLDRQGRAAHERDGRLEADGGRHRSGPRPAGHDPLRGPVRERAGQPRFGRPDVPPPDRGRRPGHGDRPRDDPLLHERRGGGAAGAAGRRPRGRRRGLHARDGGAGEHPRPRAPADPALRQGSRSRRRGGDHRCPAGREAARGARERRRGATGQRAVRASSWRRRRSRIRRPCAGDCARWRRSPTDGRQTELAECIRRAKADESPVAVGARRHRERARGGRGASRDARGRGHRRGARRVTRRSRWSGSRRAPPRQSGARSRRTPWRSTSASRGERRRSGACASEACVSS